MPKSYPQASKSQRRPWRRSPILWGSLVFLLLAVGLVVGILNTKQPPRQVLPEEATQAHPARDVLLYFAAADGQSLIAENRPIGDCQTEQDCLRDTVNALIAGPQGDLVPILPAQVVLRGVTVVGSLVQIDFSRELIATHPGGTQSELLTVYGLADTLAVNFPHLRQVQILVEGTPAATLKGHLDLRQPINPDFSLVEEGLAPTGKMLSLPTARDE